MTGERRLSLVVTLADWTMTSGSRLPSLGRVDRGDAFQTTTPRTKAAKLDGERVRRTDGRPLAISRQLEADAALLTSQRTEPAAHVVGISGTQVTSGPTEQPSPRLPFAAPTSGDSDKARQVVE